MLGRRCLRSPLIRIGSVEPGAASRLCCGAWQPSGCNLATQRASDGTRARNLVNSDDEAPARKYFLT